MMEFVIGAAVGVAGMVAKDRLFSNDKETQSKSKQELEMLYAENDKFRKRNKEMERQIEDLLADNERFRKQYKSKDDDHDDLEDELLSAKNEIKKLRVQNDDLAIKLKEYKMACEAQENKIKSLTQK